MKTYFELIHRNNKRISACGSNGCGGYHYPLPSCGGSHRGCGSNGCGGYKHYSTCY